MFLILHVTNLSRYDFLCISKFSVKNTSYILTDLNKLIHRGIYSDHEWPFFI